MSTFFKSGVVWIILSAACSSHFPYGEGFEVTAGLRLPDPPPTYAGGHLGFVLGPSGGGEVENVEALRN